MSDTKKNAENRRRQRKESETDAKSRKFAELSPVKKALSIAWKVALAAVAVVLIIFFIPKKNGSFNLNSVRGYFDAKEYLTAIKDEDYDKAFKYMHFYDSTDAVSDGTTYTEAEVKELWEKRISAERSDTYANYLEDFSDLKVFMEDGVLKATVSLAVREHGVLKTLKETVQFQNEKIYSVTEYSPALMNEFEIAVSGFMGS